MATTWNVADGTVLTGRWFHSFDFTNTLNSVVEPLKVKDATCQVFYVEKLCFHCMSTASSSKLSVFDSSLAGGRKRITGCSMKIETGAKGPQICMDFEDDPLIFAGDGSAGSGICVTCGGVGTQVTGFSGFIKGYTGIKNVTYG